MKKEVGPNRRANKMIRSSAINKLKRSVKLLHERLNELELALGSAQRDIYELRASDAVCHTEGSQAKDYRDIEISEVVPC